MILLKIKSNSPYETLAIEELILKDERFKHQDVFLLYQHDNSIIVGRNQNINEEIEHDFVKNNNITIARRISGGGAVYHDLNNLNFSFITDKTSKGYELFLQPIIAYLRSLGVPAEFQGRNDLKANDLKISGNAQFIYKDRMFSHGTLLFDVNLTVLSQALKPNPLKIQSKGIKSIRQRVGNIKDMVKNKITIDEFTNGLIEFMKKSNDVKIITEEDLNYKKLKEFSKFKSSQEWLYGKNPNFQISNTLKFEKGLVTFKANLEKNKIVDIAFEGDYLSQKDNTEILDQFIGLNYDKKSFTKVFKNVELETYFGGLNIEELITLIFG